MIRIFLLLSAILILNVISSDAGPTNDDCSLAITLTVGGGCIYGDNTSATTEGLSLPSCWGNNAGNYSNSIWYQFAATDDSISINIGDGPSGSGNWLNAKTLTAVYSGTCGSLTEVGCAINGNETVMTGLVIGNTYYVMIDGYGTNVGSFCISVYETPAPQPKIGTCSNPRDLFVASDCNNVQQGVYFQGQDNMLWTNYSTGADQGISAAGYGNPQAVDGATQGTMCSDNDASQNSYWVRFTATEATQLFSNAGVGTLDYCIFTGTCSSLASFDCYSIAGASSMTIGAGAEPDLTPGTSYLVMITNGSGNSTAKRYLCITSTTVDPCEYDNCSSAYSISSGTSYTLDNANCTADLSLCAGTTENNIWLSWTCPGNWTGSAYLHLTSEDCAGSHGMQMSIYSAGVGCVNNNTNCIMTLNPNNNNDFFGTFTPVPGSTYLLDIDGYASCACQFSFLIDNPVILPIELVSFTGNVAGKIVELNWVTASEINSDYFSIERSNNGENFEVIEKVKGAGTSFNTRTYKAEDENPLQGTSYYRLKQTDFNGASQYSKIITVHLMAASVNAEIYPNPSAADKKIHVTFSYAADEERVPLEIRDQMGQLQKQIFFSVKSGINDLIIPTENLTPGLYHVFIFGTRQQVNAILAITKSN